MSTARWLTGLLVLALVEAAAGAELKAGDLVTVNKDGAQIRKGTAVVATLNKGQRVKLNWVFKDGGYALIYYTIAGKQYAGYISLKDIEAPSGAEEKAAPSCPFVADDRVVVIAKETKLKVGDEVVGSVPEGTVLTVQKVKDAWIGVTTEIKGKPTFGWLPARDVDYTSAKGKEKAPAGKDSHEKPKE